MKILLPLFTLSLLLSCGSQTSPAPQSFKTEYGGLCVQNSDCKSDNCYCGTGMWASCNCSK